MDEPKPMRELTRIREERGLSQQGLADASGVNKATINQIERGRRSPNLETLEKLAGALAVEMADFFPKAQAPLPLDGPEGGAGDPAEAATMIGALADTAAELAGAWNRDVEFYEQNGRSLFPYRTLEMGLAVEALYRHFWKALAVLQNDAEALGRDPNPASWEPQSKELLLETGANIRALSELRSLIEGSAANAGDNREDSRALRKEFDAGASAFLEEDPQWGEAIEKARAAAGIA